MLLTAEAFSEASKLAKRILVTPAEMHLVLGFGSGRFYRRHRQLKPDGGFRNILAPQEPLLKIQRRLLKYVFDRLPVSNIAHAYVKGRSICTNADAHIGSRSILLLDIFDAFGSVGLNKVVTEQLKMNSVQLSLVKHLVEFCVVKPRLLFPDERRFLPQGAPTSGAIFNLVCREIDRDLAHLASNTGCVVTRYSDNICFSSPKPDIEPALVRAVVRTVTKSQRSSWPFLRFELNPRKTRLIRNANRNGVPLRLPGVNIIEGSMSLDPATIRHYRLALYCAGKAYAQATDPDQRKKRWSEYAGIKGHVYEVYGGWPKQLDGVWAKAHGLSSSDIRPIV